MYTQVEHGTHLAAPSAVYLFVALSRHTTAVSTWEAVVILRA